MYRLTVSSKCRQYNQKYNEFRPNSIICIIQSIKTNIRFYFIGFCSHVWISCKKIISISISVLFILIVWIISIWMTLTLKNRISNRNKNQQVKSKNIVIKMYVKIENVYELNWRQQFNDWPKVYNVICVSSTNIILSNKYRYPVWFNVIIIIKC